MRANRSKKRELGMTEGITIIEVWDVETFDSELRGDLDAHADVIRDYILTSRHSRRRTTRREFSARLFNPLCERCSTRGINWDFAAE